LNVGHVLPLSSCQVMPIYRPGQGLIGAVPINIYRHTTMLSQWNTRPNGRRKGRLGLTGQPRQPQQATPDAAPTRRTRPQRTVLLLIPSEKVPPAPSMYLGAHRRERAAKARRSGWNASSAPPRYADNARKTPFEHFRSGAPRYEGWHATRACFFTPKAC
jgi:hypothetical protein